MIKDNISNIIQAHKIWLDSDGKDGSQANFYGQKLEEIILDNFDLRYAIFTNVNMIRSHITNCNLQGCDFSFTDFSYSQLKNNDFSHANLTNSNFDGSTIFDSNFSNTKLNNTNFYKAKTINLNFSNSNGINTSFTSSQLINANFNEVEYENVRFKQSNITNSLFIDSILVNSSLDDSIGIPKDYKVKNIEYKNKVFINSRPIINLVSKFSNLFYILSIFTTVILFVSLFFNQLKINYLQWSLFIIFLIIIATAARIGKYIIIKNDKILNQDYKNE